jgi:hypothetical protein
LFRHVSHRMLVLVVWRSWHAALRQPLLHYQTSFLPTLDWLIRVVLVLNLILDDLLLNWKATNCPQGALTIHITVLRLVAIARWLLVWAARANAYRGSKWVEVHLLSLSLGHQSLLGGSVSRIHTWN